MRRFLKLFRLARGVAPIYKDRLQSIALVGVIIGTTLFFAGGITTNNIRLVICAFLILVLGVCCLRIETGITGILVFLPFMAFIRRFIYYFNPYIGYDPILIISPILTLFMFSYIFIFQGEELMRLTKENKLLRYITYFLILLVLQIFNPIQGGLAVGFAGIIYWIIPFIWFYFGFFLSKSRLHTIFYIMIGIGVITSLYGLHQIYRGFLPFEEYWIRYGGFAALKVKGFTKAFSTFTNPQELANYLLIAGAISFVYLFKRPFTYPVWIGCIIVLLYGLFMTSSRGTIFLFFAFIAVFISVKAMNWKRAIALNLLFLCIVFYGISKLPLPDTSIPVGSAKSAHLRHLVKGIQHPLAKEGSTAMTRLSWIPAVFYDLLHTPFGRGIGATTLAVSKFGGKGVAGEEVFHFAISGSLGLPGIILYLLIMYWIIKMSIFLVRKDSETYLLPATLAIWFTFAVEPRLYSTGPFIWLLWGWLAKEWQLNRQ